MQIISSPLEMQQKMRALKDSGKRIAFVPTMGALHEGHLKLLDDGRKRGDVLVLSIYVNPTQFGPKEDLSRYPRDLAGDIEKARTSGVDYIFTPTDKDIYPEGYQTFVSVRGVSEGLCGASRPGHFDGVATVVLKLFNIVMPDVAIFGLKDYQQYLVIKTMVRDLAMPVEIVGHPIVREADGLAMSSRNVYLSPDEHKAALSLNQSLKLAQEMIAGSEKNVEKIKAAITEKILSAKLPKIDYVEIRDAETLEPTSTIDNPAVIALAAFVGKTRLIDNAVIKSK